MLIAEADSRTFHATHRAFEHDRERDRMLMADGWRVVRYTAREVRERPQAIVEELRHLLSR